MDLLSRKPNHRRKRKDILKDKLKDTESMYEDQKMKAKEYVKRRKSEIKECYDRRLSENFRVNQKLFWYMAKKAQNNSETSCVHVNKDEDGHLLNKENNVKERWKNNFESVFAREDTVADDNVTATGYIIDDGNVTEIKIDKIIKALKRIKVGKAAGYDRVSSEMLRGGGGIVASLL
ncbi:hypothetical protein EVAR_66515_1 [Eumeta japonica]|uniref:Uncharacterized protein n=1 Tax=Eumeta variegata TaxID=151549 RepID=A0A4C1ZBH3_EUMVA|nr:hypothetical protein EVAR_66515_1 [Eumeta japonica]